MLSVLVSLVLNQDAATRIVRLLRPEILPSLKSLALYAPWRSPSSTNPLRHAELVHLLAQLEAFVVPVEMWSDADSNLFNRFGDKTLLDLRSTDTTNYNLSAIRHLRIKSMSPTTSDEIANLRIRADLLFVFILLKSSELAALRSLYLNVLPPLLKSSSLTLHKLTNEASELVSWCKSLKIEVIFEEQPTSRGLGLRTSQVFWSRMKAEMKKDPD
ncbi:hypothetical protein JCM3765_005793 [Sporobolomyces pararoseus]